jgi:transcriptional regulator with XRE-family HTH domain
LTRESVAKLTPPLPDLGARLQRLRLERGFSQRSLAQKAGVDQQVVEVCEQHKGTPELNSALLLARALDITIDYLVGE